MDWRSEPSPPTPTSGETMSWDHLLELIKNDAYDPSMAEQVKALVSATIYDKISTYDLEGNDSNGDPASVEMWRVHNIPDVSCQSAFYLCTACGFLIAGKSLCPTSNNVNRRATKHTCCGLGGTKKNRVLIEKKRGEGNNLAGSRKTTRRGAKDKRVATERKRTVKKEKTRNEKKRPVPEAPDLFFDAHDDLFEDDNGSVMRSESDVSSSASNSPTSLLGLSLNNTNNASADAHVAAAMRAASAASAPAAPRSEFDFDVPMLTPTNDLLLTKSEFGESESATPTSLSTLGFPSVTPAAARAIAEGGATATLYIPTKAEDKFSAFGNLVDSTACGGLPLAETALHNANADLACAAFDAGLSSIYGKGCDGADGELGGCYKAPAAASTDGGSVYDAMSAFAQQEALSSDCVASGFGSLFGFGGGMKGECVDDLSEVVAADDTNMPDRAPSPSWWPTFGI